MNWDLTFADVKMLCRNSIGSSELEEDEKQQQLDKWEKFLHNKVAVLAVFLF